MAAGGTPASAVDSASEPDTVPLAPRTRVNGRSALVLRLFPVAAQQAHFLGRSRKTGNTTPEQSTAANAALNGILFIQPHVRCVTSK